MVCVTFFVLKATDDDTDKAGHLPKLVPEKNKKSNPSVSQVHTFFITVLVYCFSVVGVWKFGQSSKFSDFHV